MAKQMPNSPTRDKQLIITQINSIQYKYNCGTSVELCGICWYIIGELLFNTLNLARTDFFIQLSYTYNYLIIQQWKKKSKQNAKEHYPQLSERRWKDLKNARRTYPILISKQDTFSEFNGLLPVGTWQSLFNVVYL